MPAVAARTGIRVVPWWAWTVLAIAVVIAVVAALGGFATAPIQRVPTIARGSAFHGQQVEARIIAARVTGRSPVGEKAAAGSAWLELDVDDLNTTSAPVPVAAVTLRTIAGPLTGTTDPDRVVSTRDSGGVTQLQPGIRTRIAFLWRIPAGSVRDGDRVVVGIFETAPAADDEGPVSGPPDVKARMELGAQAAT